MLYMDVQCSVEGYSPFDLFIFFLNQCYIIFFNIKIRLIITVNFWKSSGK